MINFFNTYNEDAAALMPNPRGPELSQVDDQETTLLEAAGAGVMRGAADIAGAVTLAAGGLYGFGEEDRKKQDKIFKFYDEVIRPARDYWTPDPESTSTAGKIVGGISSLVVPLMLGPGGAETALIGSSTFSTGADLVDEGVDPLTATGLSVLNAAATGLMVKLPASGKNLAQTLALIASNPVIGGVQTAAEKKVLESRGYDELAKSFNPYDPIARTLDLVLGSVFGGMAHYGRVREALPVQLNDAVDVASLAQNTAKNNPLEGPKNISRHTEALNKAVEDVAEGKPVDVAPVLRDIKPDEIKPAMVEPEAVNVRDIAVTEARNIEQDIKDGNLFSSDNFTRNDKGSINFGSIDGEIARAINKPKAPIRMEQGNMLYGETHIAKDKLDRIKKAGYQDVRSFVAEVAEKYNQIWEQPNGRLMLVKRNGRSDLAVVELKNEGDYYSVSTAFPADLKYPEKGGRKLLWERSKPISASPEKLTPLANATLDNSQVDSAWRSGQSNTTLNSDSNISSSPEKVNPQKAAPKAKKRRPSSETDSLADFVRNSGGISTEKEFLKGEVRDRFSIREGYNLVNNKTGSSLDRMTEYAFEEGYFRERPDTAEFLDALRKDVDSKAAGKKGAVWSLKKQNWDDVWEDEFQAEMERMLLEHGDMEIYAGTDSDGAPVSMSARDLIDDARVDVAKAESMQDLYNMAAGCLRRS